MRESLGSSLRGFHVEGRRDWLCDARVEGGCPTWDDERRVDMISGCWSVVACGGSNVISERGTHLEDSTRSRRAIAVVFGGKMTANGEADPKR